MLMCVCMLMCCVYGELDVDVRMHVDGSMSGCVC